MNQKNVSARLTPSEIISSLPFSRKYSEKEIQIRKEEIVEKADLDVVDAYEFRLLANRDIRLSLISFTDSTAVFVAKHKKARIGKLKGRILITSDSYLASLPPICNIKTKNLANVDIDYQLFQSYENLAEIILTYIQNSYIRISANQHNYSVDFINTTGTLDNIRKMCKRLEQHYLSSAY